MGGSRSGASRARMRPVEEAKRIVLAELQKGQTVANACIVADRSVKTYEAWRLNDATFKAQVERIRNNSRDQIVEDIASGLFPTFPEFSEKYLGAKVYPHTQNVVDLIEHREPAWLHSSEPRPAPARA